MAGFLLQLSYTPQAWADLMRNPQDRAKAVRGVIEQLGGKIGAVWLAFGESDLIGIVSMPDNLTAAAFSIALAAGGACRTVKTTPLITMEEGVAAMEKAAACGYAPIGAET